MKHHSPSNHFKTPAAMLLNGTVRHWMIATMLLLAHAVSAQEIADSVYWIYFTDKSDNGYSLNQPGDFLSERSIHRRGWQGLGVDVTDEPVTRAYVDTLRAMGVEVRHTSRWLNGVAMGHTSRELFEQVLERPFTDTVPWKPAIDEIHFPPLPVGQRFEPPLLSPVAYDYGVATEQVQQVKTDVLHRAGYTGAGVRIAVLDAGFKNVDSLPSFEPMIREGRLLGTRNFVNDSDVYRLVSGHGMSVLSIIGAHWEGEMMGTAPHASYFLCTTENIHQETRIEEIAWIEAAEYMDSLGYDLFNTSLGYSDFDGTGYDYSYRDMDGQTTFISRAASMLADKGIVSCHSAGNSGDNLWYRITAPADASNILTVGAVDSTGIITDFSSRGPSWDGRVKPEVVAMGRATGIQHGSGGVARGSGTSYSSPVIAGSAASLWQAYPDMPARELIYRIRDSGDRLDNPDATYGYGLPRFSRAYWQISKIREREAHQLLEFYPNPAQSNIQIRIPVAEAGVFKLTIYDMSGREAGVQQVTLPGEVILPGGLHPGIYIMEVVSGSTVFRNQIIIE
ncbi:MAG: S8 family peptidase [Bacteroidota bacterium]